MVHYLGGLELMLLGLHLCLERLAGMNCLHWTGVQELLRKGKGQRAKGRGDWGPHPLAAPPTARVRQRQRLRPRQQLRRQHTCTLLSRWVLVLRSEV